MTKNLKIPISKRTIKLKAILSDPYKKKCALLPDEEIEELRSILATALQNSAQSPRDFAINNHICLGMSTSLKAINVCKSSCVFLSLSIRPPFLISLLCRNTEQKDRSGPIFTQKNLESFTRDLFGVGAMVMAFPRELKNISPQLEIWVNMRRKVTILSDFHADSSRNITELKKQTERQTLPNVNEPYPATAINQMDIGETFTIGNKVCSQERAWDSDLRPFDRKTNKLDEDEMCPLNNVNTMKYLAKEKNTPSDGIIALDVTNKETDELNPNEFLGDYQVLAVHKIQPNPSKRQNRKFNNRNKKN